ncbi:Exocyst complex component SEC15 [Candida viswanathii]|uniref:Exocyst complex component SEC15 n=1 Tax=Candida viswanathii TaxID=5486 RepID=A0A367Y0P3_9ASCO|nr:Exocyst complex component SEC15 [Candida viswanathii]
MPPSQVNGSNSYSTSNGSKGTPKIPPKANGPIVDSLPLENLLLQLAPIMKNAIRNNGLNDLIVKLNEIVKAKDVELNQASMESADEINSSINTVDNIHKEADGLREQFSQISSRLNRSAYELKSRKTVYIVLNECIQVLELMNKILELIRQTKYFLALKLIDEMINIHIQKVENFSFAKKIVDSIPHLTMMVKDESFENLSKWLSLNLERKLQAIAGGLYNNLDDLHNNWINSPVELALREPELNYNIFEDDSLQISLNSVFDAILVYLTLQELEILSSAYYKEWMTKYSRVIYPITTASVGKKDVVFDNNELYEYLRKIAAFFVADKQLNLVTKFQLVLIQLLMHRDFKDIAELSAFKTIIGEFLQIMDNNDYDVSELYEVMMMIFKDYYVTLTVQSFRKQFVSSIQSDHYRPLIVSDKASYNGIIANAWYKKDASFVPENVKEFPVTFPFSEDYVHFCFHIRKLIKDILRFTEDYYSYEIGELNNIIVNNIIEVVLSGEKGFGIGYEIKQFIDRNENNKEITAQTYTNLEYYLLSFEYRIEETHWYGVHNIDANDTFTLHAVDTFVQLKKHAEGTIFKMVDTKINELLDMVEYDDYLPVERNAEANFAIKDFALFLENLFTSIFSNLPLQLRTLGLFRTYDFVSEYFLNVLNDARYIEASMKHLHGVKDDADLGNGGNVALETTFTELRQCIDLLNLDDYDEFVNNSSFRMRQFDRVKYEEGMALIKKMKDNNLERNPTIASERAFLLPLLLLQGSPFYGSVESSPPTSKLAQFTTRFKQGK